MSDNKIRRFESQMADMLPSMVRIAPGTIDIISSGAYQLPVGIYMSRERYEKLIAVAEAAHIYFLKENPYDIDPDSDPVYKALEELEK